MATKNLKLDELESTLKDNDIVLIDFWAEWCGPCRMFGPTFEKVSEKHPDIAFTKVNTEEEQQLIADSSLNTHDALMDRLNQLKQTRADAEITVNTQQKIVNEANRNIEALEVIADSSAETSDDVLDLIDKLKQRRQEALNTRDAASVVANQAATEAEQIVTELRTVAVVLK